MIRVLLADDQALVRGALAALLDLEGDIEVVAQVGRGDQVVAAARESGAQVAMLDIEMPGLDGIEAAARLSREVPECRSLIVTTFGRPGYLRRALEAGANGFVVKDSPAAALADAVRRVHAGLRAVDPDLAVESLSSGANPLSEREQEVLRAGRDGAPVREVARRVFLSPGTVRNHLSSAIGKTSTHTRAEAIQVAEANGWL
ncbi:MAG: response regulator transcription factor [Ruaniaceae bacterium]|nr:response regulator transcription factor [Ruaniaceae bacterium]